VCVRLATLLWRRDLERIISSIVRRTAAIESLDFFVRGLDAD